MTHYGIKLHWGPPSQKNELGKAIGFSETAFKRWQNHLPCGTRMLLYSTSTRGGTKEIHAEVEVCGSFADGEAHRPANPEHAHMLPVGPLLQGVNLTPVPLSRIREVLENARWPHQGLSWQPLSEETYETLRAELLGKEKSA